MSRAEPADRMTRAVVVAIIASALSVMLSAGIRQGFGLFLTPITAELGVGRETFGIAAAISNLMFGIPVMGFLAERFGSRLVLGAGGAVYAVGLLLVTQWVATAGLIAGLGILVGIGLAATTYVVVLGALVQLVSPRQRGTVFGIITAMGSAGFLVMPPVAQWLVDNYGWQQAIRIEAVLILSVVLLSLGLPGKQKKERQTAAGKVMEPEVPLWSFVREGFTKPSYLLLVSGFVVCGFHIAFIGTHLPVYLEDHGIGHIRGAALAFIGAFNLVGSLTFGWLADRLPRRFLLSFIYGMRGVVLLIYLLAPLSVGSTLLFSAAMGLLWLATVPVTSGTVALLFGPKYLAVMYGFVFFSHQVGAFFGAWWSGRVYDATGSYDLGFYVSIALGLYGLLVHLPIREKPVEMKLTQAHAAA